MSGAEAIAVLGLVSSVITVVDSIKRVYEAASNTQGLPEAFREVYARLPIVQNILRIAKQQIEGGNANDGFYKGAQEIVENCCKKMQKLEEIFQKVMPADGASRAERYLSAVKTLGKGSRVENLMKGTLEDVQLLATNSGMMSVTSAQRKEVADAIKEVDALSPSLPEHALEETGFTAIHSGSGAINQASGDQYNNPGSGHIYHAHSMNFGANDSETTGTQACLAALFQALRSDPRDDREKLLHRKGSRVDGTCRWITSDKLYDSWLKSHSGLLWLSGGPGGGKTMLSIFLAEELERKAKESQNAVLLEFFCDNKDERRNTASSVVCGLLFRLLQLRPKLFDHILPTFNIQKEQLFAAPSFESLWRIFSAMVHDPDAGSVYCVLDGLDECNETASELLLQRLKSVLTRSKDFSPCCLHVIVASRDFPEVIPEVLSSFSRIRLDGDAASDVKVDIRNFIDVKIDELSRYRDYPPFLRHRMRKTFQDRANGTFLWIGIVAQALRKYKASEAEKALDLFPSGLDAIYARLLLQVEVNRRETVAKILRWVVMAVRPLTLSELSAALQLEDASSNDFDREEVMKDQISHCGYLLTLENEKVNLIHQSAKEYLLGETHVSCYELKLFHIDQPRANLEIARTCLQYLHNGALAEKIDHYRDLAARERLFPMLSYAVYNWPHHAKSLARSEDIFDLSHPFYAEESPVRTKWLTTYVLAGPWHVLTPITSRLLLIASSFGILPLVENLLVRKSLWHTFKRKSYVNQKDSMGLTALDYAAVRGQKAVVSLLIDHGARHQEHTDPQQAALSMAAIFGHESVVSLLLENSDRLGVTDRDKVEALQSAAFKGSEAMFWTILKHQEKVQGNNDLKHRAKEQALVSAAYGGNVPAIRALLDHGVHVDSKDDRRKTALHASAWRSDGATARLLLDRRADINSKDRSGRTPLHDSVNGAWSASNRATQNSAETVMRLLLTEKADIEAETNIGRTALHLAAEVRSESLIRCLLEGGARLRAKDHEGLTALDLAAAAAQATDDHQPQGYRTFLRVQYEPVMRLLTAREE